MLTRHRWAFSGTDYAPINSDVTGTELILIRAVTGAKFLSKRAVTGAKFLSKRAVTGTDVVLDCAAVFAPILSQPTYSHAKQHP